MDLNGVKIGISVNDGYGVKFTDLILSGKKTIETRSRRTLDPFIGEWVGLVRTGVGKATLVGYVKFGKPIRYSNDDGGRKMSDDYDKHFVSQDDAYYKGGEKWGYPILKVVPVTPRVINSYKPVTEYVRMDGQVCNVGQYVARELNEERIIREALGLDVVSLDESELKRLVYEGVKESLSLLMKEQGDQFNIKNVYHVSGHNFDQFEKKHFDCFFFSNKPIEINGSKVIYVCNLSMHKPLVFTDGTSWSYPLWLFLSDRDGYLIPEEEFTPEKYDGYLGCPYEFWKMVYYDDYEYNMDEIPDLVKSLNMGYDGIIIKGIQEGDTGIDVDDYIVFDQSQIQIVNKTIRKTPDNYLE